MTMKRLLSVATLVTLITGAWPAHAGVESPYCVACIDADRAQPDPNFNVADYCAWVPDLAGRKAFEERCFQRTDLAMVIWNPTNATTPAAADCSANLLESAVICPGQSSAPALTGVNLFTLALVLGALGVVVLQRRTAASRSAIER